MIDMKNNAKCSGCSACVNVCPVQCISMEEDGEGFLYPHVDTGRCAQCGVCEKVCPVLSRQESKSSPVLNVYACMNRNAEERLSSSSGGLFSLLAEEILRWKGTVYGVAMSEDCYGAELIRVDDVVQLYRLRGSKYLQADAGDVYRKVKSDLEIGIDVLFSGTGCQVNGLKAFLGNDYPNLFCIDVICHGVPSPALWRKYVEHLEKQNDAKLVSVNFRCKDDSWQDFGMKELHEGKKEIFISKDTDPYMQMFLRDYCLRPSCYECVAKDVKRADITMADFWGIENVAPDMNDGRGTSLVLIRSKKGAQLFGDIVASLTYKEVSYEDGVRGNPSEFKSVARPRERDVFFKDMNTLEFPDLQKKYAAPIPISYKQWVKGKIKKTLPKAYKWYRMLKSPHKKNKFSGGGED